REQPKRVTSTENHRSFVRAPSSTPPPRQPQPQSHLHSLSLSGRVDVWRRRDYSGYSCYNNTSCGGIESNRGRSHHGAGYKNGKIRYNLSSNGHGHDLAAVQAEFCGQKKGIDDAPRVTNVEISKHEDNDEIQMTPGKKRKFSPIIWDLDEKKVRISSKIRVVQASTHLSPPLCPPALNVFSDSGLSSVTLVGGIISKSPVVKPLPLLEKGDDQEEGQLEQEDFNQARNISSSRWASDGDSPRDTPLSHGGATPKEEEKILRSGSSGIVVITSSTSESREFSRESSERDRCRLSGSVERVPTVVTLSDDECSEKELQNDDDMSINGTRDDSAHVSQLESAVEDPNVSSQTGMDMLHSCRSVYEFEKLNKINEGTYGIVYRARDKKTNEFVALKKVKMNGGREYLEYGFPLCSLREINILSSFNHPSIVDFKEVVMGRDPDSVFMVMEYMEHDLKGLMDKMKQQRFSTSEVKCLMIQILEGVKYLHDNWVLHRDLKTSNILFNNKGELKICDFGLSRQYGSPLKPYTSLVVTLHYRAPELLLGAKQYSAAIDMWSVGCIMAELLASETLFQGKTEVDQLQKIFRVLGTPNETIWPGLSKLPSSKANFVKQPYNLLRKKFPAASFTGSPSLSDTGFDLLNKLLTYDPAKRITAAAALNHEWFHEVPLPKCKEFMPTFPPQHAQR
ncbi:Pkinase domain-containing protein, partial [Cephalotus follicularis]